MEREKRPFYFRMYVRHNTQPKKKLVKERGREIDIRLKSRMIPKKTNKQ